MKPMLTNWEVSWFVDGDDDDFEENGLNIIE